MATHENTALARSSYFLCSHIVNIHLITNLYTKSLVGFGVLFCYYNTLIWAHIILNCQSTHIQFFIITSDIYIVHLVE